MSSALPSSSEIEERVSEIRRPTCGVTLALNCMVLSWLNKPPELLLPHLWAGVLHRVAMRSPCSRVKPSVWLCPWHAAGLLEARGPVLGLLEHGQSPGRGPLVFLCPQLQPIHEILRHTNLGSLEAQRQNLRRALDQYLMEFNACRCGPCFNKGVPILEGTSCKCECPTGHDGFACEKAMLTGKVQAS